MTSNRRLDPSSAINRLADFLATATGFLTTFAALIIGVAIGALLHFNDGFMLGFNLALSVLAISFRGSFWCLARAAKRHFRKLDRLIEASAASNTIVGLEHKGVAEIEEQRKRVERDAAAALDNRIDQEVAEEVTEQLDERGVGSSPR